MSTLNIRLRNQRLQYQNSASGYWIYILFLNETTEEPYFDAFRGYLLVLGTQ